MSGLADCLLKLQGEGRLCVAASELRHRLGVSEAALAASITRQLRNGTLARLYPGFYVLLRPEDGVYGLPDPLLWLDQLMEHLGTPYRVSLWRSAALHGSSHQAAMQVQVVAPRQLRSIQRGRVCVHFLSQQQHLFETVNCVPWIDRVATSYGYCNVAGALLTLADCLHYIQRLGGIDHAAQIVSDLAFDINHEQLLLIAPLLDNTIVRRLGYLLDVLGYTDLARLLEPYARRARNWVPLAPCEGIQTSAQHALPALRNSTWKLLINHNLELDD